jgi:formylglycine-generating enzyme required for sulfatase activity
MNMRDTNLPADAGEAEHHSADANLFVTVPETTLPNGYVVRAFQVGQYYCAKGDDGKAVISAEGKPWVGINYAEARAACAAIGGALLTESQALALAWNVSQVAANWSGGGVGIGTLMMGLHKGSVYSGQPGKFMPKDAEERRGFHLTNGDIVFDVAGNVYGWIFDDVQGDENGIVAGAFAEDSPSIKTAPFPSCTQGMGWFPRAGSNWSSYALFRGGCWCSGGVAGVFRLSYGWPDYRDGVVGFRCTKPVGL